MNVSGWAPPAPGRVAGGIPWLAPSGHLLKYPWSTADEPSFRLTSWVAVVVTLHIVAISKNTVIVYHHHQLTDMLPVAARKCPCHWASTAARQPLIVFSMWWNSDGVMKNPSGFKESPMACEAKGDSWALSWTDQRHVVLLAAWILTRARGPSHTAVGWCSHSTDEEWKLLFLFFLCWRYEKEGLKRRLQNHSNVLQAPSSSINTVVSFAWME